MAPNTRRCIPNQLLQAVHFIDETLEFGSAQQLESVFLAGEKLQGDATRGGHQVVRIFKREFTLGDDVQGQVHGNAKAPRAPAFFVNLFLARRASDFLRHKGPLSFIIEGAPGGGK